MIDVNRDLIVELEDNGCGFDGHNQARAGRGLNNMRSRASLINAQLEWNTKPQGAPDSFFERPSQPLNQ